MTRRAVDDFGDRLVFDEDDLRWKELFSWESLKSYLRMKGEEFSFVRELIVNNQYTSNFQRLVDQILSRLKALEKSKGSKPPDTVFEVCAGFCLVLAILQQATLSAADLIKFLSLKTQPELIFSHTLVADDRSTAMERLFVATTHLLTTVDDSLVDIQYFAANLMILLIHVHDFHGVDFFWRALQLHALEGMQQALANPTNSSAFSSCVAVRIVRNLLYFAVNAREEHLQSSAQSNSAKKFRMEPCRGVVLPRIVDLLANQPSRSLMATGGGQGSSPLQAAGHLLGAIQHIFYDLVARIPVKGLQDFILSSTSQLKTFQERLTGALPAALRGEASTSGSSSTHQRFKPYFPQECFAQLLLLLLHHRHSMAFNPFRQSFSYLADLELDAAGAGGDDQDIEMLNMRGMPTSLAVNYVHVNLRLIVDVMTDMLPNPTFVLLLYSFLQMHPTFIETLRHMDVAKTIFVQLLRGVYQACTLATPGSGHSPPSAAAAAASDGSSSSPVDDTTSDGATTSMNHLYTLTVCLLILIQDTMLFSRFAHETVLMSWYKERSSSSMKLLDAVIVVMLRTMSFAVFRVQDSYLLSNLCAIFMNVLPSCRALHPYASERLVRTIFSFARRIVRTRQHERMMYNHQQQQHQQQQQQYPHASGAATTNPSTVATAVLSSSTPRFIQRGAHKWQVSHGGSLDASETVGGHNSDGPTAAQLRLPSLASASLDYSYHNYPHPTAASSTTMGDPVSSSSSSSSSATTMRRRPSISSLSGMDHLEADVMLLQVALMTLTQFTVVLVKASIAENVYFLYALVSDFASLQRYFPAGGHPLASAASDASSAYGNTPGGHGDHHEDILQDEIETDATILANHEDTAEWRVLYEDMTTVTALTEYYVMKFDQRTATKADDPRASEQYFTAKEAANYLKGEVLRHHQASSVLHDGSSHADGYDVEGGGGRGSGGGRDGSLTGQTATDDDDNDNDDRQRYQLLLYRLHRGYIPSLTAHASVFNEYYRSQYCYQEAENAAEFFVPYIWSCVVNVLQGSTAAP